MEKKRQRTANDAVKSALESSYITPAIREAREFQDNHLRQRFVGQPLTIADIGCGDGYHGAIFAPGCRLYHGFEIAPELAAIARQRWESAGLENSHVFEGDVTELDLPQVRYDLALCLYFTPGNFRDDFEDLALYTDAYLDRNPRFITMVSRFHQALRPGGSMFLTVYKDVAEAEAAQYDFYDRTGMHVTSPKGSRFVQTEENFWSVRFTERSMLTNLGACEIAPEDVIFHDLNPISWLVEITRR